MGIQVKLFRNLLLSKGCLTGILMLAATVLMPKSAVASTAAADSVMRFTEKIYFKKSSAEIDSTFGGNSAALERIGSFTAGADTLSGLRIEVCGSASPEGTREFNRRLARHRADAMLGLLKPTLNVAAVSDTVVSAAGHDAAGWPSLRFASLTASWALPIAVQISGPEQFGG